MQTAEMQTSRPPVSGIVWGLVLNAIIPVALYNVSRRYMSPSEFIALVVASTFPFGKSIFDLMRLAQVDPISIVVLLGIATDDVAFLLGGSPRLLLVRESLFTETGQAKHTQKRWHDVPWLARADESSGPSDDYISLIVIRCKFSVFCYL